MRRIEKKKKKTCVKFKNILLKQNYLMEKEY